MPTRRRFLRDSASLVGAAALAPRAVAAQDRGAGAGPARPEFDYIIIGAGAAGCVLANRLTTDPNTRVLLVEAGASPKNPAIEVPGKWVSLLGTDIDWNYTTEPEPGLGDRSIRWPRGRGYGGSTLINAMAYVRGHRLSFARWSELAGPSWSFDAVLPYFRRLEHNSRGASDYRGAGGPLAVSDTTDPHQAHLAFLEGARQLGFSARPDWDFNGPRQENGAGFYQKNIRNGRRDSAATAFLAPAMKRSNLVVWPGMLVRQIVLTGARATGIECSRQGAVVRPIATRGVVLAAGVIESPKLLMLSGIGPGETLRKAGVAVRVDSPNVGLNLHDHPRVGVRWAGRTKLPPSTVSAGLITWSSRGPLPLPPDIQFYVGRGIDTPDPFITLTMAVSQPRSRGSVTLRSADPQAAPAIRANYYQDGRDLDAMVRAVQLAIEIANTPPYTPLRGAPSDQEIASPTPANLRAYIRRTSDTIFHPVGSCRMGSDAASVVDPQLRVRGADALWVVDSSVMPETVNCQTLAASLMMAERAAEFIT